MNPAEARNTVISGRLNRFSDRGPEELSDRLMQDSMGFDLSDSGGGDDLPDRYEVRQRDGETHLLCEEAPGVTVRIDRRYAFTEAEARKLGDQVILLDGAGQFAPTVDDANHLYNLDHHQDCLRAFTLATCEQALILVLKGLRLDKGDWNLYANEPDLDTVFALWVLLNYRRVRTLTPAQRDAIVPLLRLEGSIDANGLEIAAHCGLPQKVLEVEKQRLDALHAREMEVKQSGQWGAVDLAEYTRDMLLAIDQYVYKASDFLDYTSVEEVYGHVDIGADHVAVICRDGTGIYEVERRLKKVWGDRLGLIALENDPGQMTLRRTADLVGIVLTDAYEKLNLLDPEVDGRPPEKRWGGSDEIGGSPRPTGTALTPREIGNILKITFQPVSRWQHLQRFATAALWTAGLFLAALVTVFGWRHLVTRPQVPMDAAGELALAAGVLGCASWLLTRKLSSGWTWLFGWRRPASWGGWPLAIPILLGGVFGGAWVPRLVDPEPYNLALACGAAGVGALAVALAFTGLVHGLLILDNRVQSVIGPWFLSRPAVTAGVLQAAVTTAAASLWIAPSLATGVDRITQLALTGLAAFVCGLAMAMLRERTLSLWPTAVLLFLAALVRLTIELWGPLT